MEYEGEAVEAPAMPTERRSNFDVNKKQARSLQIGDTVTVTVKGEVCGISRGYGLKPADEVYNLEVKFKGMPKVESNAADATLRDMVGEKAPWDGTRTRRTRALTISLLGNKGLTDG